MKTRLGILFLLAAGYTSQAQVEMDDMYFNAKDRAKLRDLQQQESAEREAQLNEASKANLTMGGSDSYSGRNVNPEYTSRLKTNPSSQQEDPQYFLSGYQPVGVNPNFRNSYYAPGTFTSPFDYRRSPWIDPYFGYNSGFGNPYAFNNSFYGDPYMNMGMGYGYPGSYWSLSFGYGWNSWGMPSYSYWDFYYGNFNSWGWGWGNPYCYNYYSRYPTQVIVIDTDNGGGPRVVYGKRSDRSNSLNNDVSNTRPISSVTRSGREISPTGRTRTPEVSGTQQNQQSYYDRSWRKNTTATNSAPQRSVWGTESNGSRSTSTPGATQQNNTRQRTWSNDSFSNSNSRSWSNSNSSSSGSSSRSFSAPSNSGSSGSSSRSRGRD